MNEGSWITYCHCCLKFKLKSNWYSRSVSYSISFSTVIYLFKLKISWSAINIMMNLFQLLDIYFINTIFDTKLEFQIEGIMKIYLSSGRPHCAAKMRMIRGSWSRRRVDKIRHQSCAGGGQQEWHQSCCWWGCGGCQ